LNSYGARETSSVVDTKVPRFDLSTTTHIITDEIDFPEYGIAIESGVPSVTVLHNCLLGMSCFLTFSLYLIAKLGLQRRGEWISA
jgi:hypothetical protein